MAIFPLLIGTLPPPPPISKEDFQRIPSIEAHAVEPAKEPAYIRNPHITNTLI